MKKRKIFTTAFAWGPDSRRRGAFVAVAFFCLMASMGLVALSVDIGMIARTKIELQNAVDAAALAAASEINASLEAAGDNVQDADDVDGEVQDANSIATTAARAMAVKVGELNDVYINGQTDVAFGKRVFNDSTGAFEIQWGVTPYNVVKVTARRDNSNPDAPDGQLKLMFAPVLGEGHSRISAKAISFVEARDIVVVMDFSRSMNFDSRFLALGKLNQSDIENNMEDIYNALDPANFGNMPFDPAWVTVSGQPASGPVPHIDVTWKAYSVDVVSTKDLSNVVLEFSNGRHYKFDNLKQGKTGTFQGTGRNSGKRIRKVWVKSGSNASGDGPGYGEKFDFYNNNTIKKALGVNSVNWPYPGGSWDSFINYCRDGYNWEYYLDNAGYRFKFGGACLVEYLLHTQYSHSKCPDLWKTPHYPFHAVKQGCTLFTEFLGALEFGDHIGLVSYDSYHRIETTLDEPGLPAVDISANPLTNNYTAINDLQRHKQAAHYHSATNTGGGMADAINLLTQYGRYGARPTILLMTDGNANTVDPGWSVPAGWNWHELTDYDGDGYADYTTNDSGKLYAFVKAKEAIDAGYTIHTMSVGADADRDLMKAIAFAGKGQWIDVPGGSTVASLEAEMLTAFSKIAANVPPPKLLRDPADVRSASNGNTSD